MATVKKQKNAFDQLKARGITSMETAVEFLRGKTVRILNTYNGHNYGTTGTKFTISKNIVNNYGAGGKLYSTNYLNNALEGYHGNAIYLTSFIVVEPTTDLELQAEIKEIDKQIATLESEKATLEQKRKFIKKYGLESFDETEFKVFAVLEELDKGSDNVSKAKAIAKLIDNN